MPQQSKLLRDEFKTGKFQVEDAPNPITVVMEHSKTLITISTAFMALVATFSEKLLSDEPTKLQCWLYLILWILLLAGMSCGVVAAQWLHMFILWPSEDDGEDNAKEKAKRMHNLSADAANIGPYCLLAAGITAAWLSVSKISHGRTPLDANQCVKAAIAYLNDFPGTATPNWVLDKMELNQSNNLCELTLKMPQDSLAYALVLDTKKGTVTSAKRIALDPPKDQSAKSFIVAPNITNVITNIVHVAGTTNVIEISPATNIVGLPTITNNVLCAQLPSTNAHGSKRWFFGLGFGSEKQN